MALAGKWIELLARTVALLGGFVLVVLAIITVASITGRALIPVGLRPIPGDFELVEAGTAFVVCAFLPWAQLKRGHASVGIFTDFMGPGVNRALDLAGDVLLLAAAVVMTWRHTYGLLDKLAYNETTFILRFPLWWAYAGCLFGLIVWIVVATYCTLDSAMALKRREDNAVRDSDHSSTDLEAGH